ncbi:sulfite exporter TauE/SafE family protein [Sporosarcina thermotolerans]|uniref:Probable membrane transporter protein n=1 Tax=Sporosarcina thermotolerans TaxID=633404 RepID=A0AAW9AD80_9BACL|nr:sulfite exporter TauE/SafE family protein [Sporosarcina thermotolerans]MDW0117576.1 sulfite exporter TauE/SafE family protein [Sporosarcina thermotolerans]WHT49729.1 sulfite exporter TauE/SafE family protein [Sporosarcina thermotolerans]
MAYVLLAIIGAISGIMGSIVGLGGGTILVPLTLLVGINLGWIPGITPQSVVGISVIMMIFNGLSSTLSHMKGKTVDFRTGWIFFAGSIPGLIIGAFVNKGINLQSFNLYFGILLIVLSILLLSRKYLKPIKWFVEHGKPITFIDKNGDSHVYGYPIWFALILTFIIGFASGLFGIGGGTMIVPALILLFLFPPHVAVGTSMFIVFLSAIANSATHISLGHVPWLYALPVIPGAYIGGMIGTKLNKKMNSDTLVLVLRIMLLLFGIRSIIEGIWG